MSLYTTQLRNYCESVTGLYDDDYKMVIDASIPHVFSFTFPFYTDDTTKLLDFERAVIKHFYTREIGDETIGLFKLRLDDKLNEIMPYYNLMFKTVEKDFDPLHTHDLDIENDGNVITDTTGNIKNTYDTVGETNGKLHSSNFDSFEERKLDTPQGSIQNLKDGKYISSGTVSNTSANKDSTENQSTTTNTISDSDTINKQASEQHSTHKERGRVGYSVGNLLKDYYESIRNIYSMIFDELEPLFFSLW